MFQIGDFRIHLMNESQTLVDPGGVFGLVPRALWSRYIMPNDDYLVPMRQTCLLVQTGAHNIVVDTGLGDKLSEKYRAQWQHSSTGGGLMGAIERLGLSAADITMVINTHLHSDHCGGNTHYDEAGRVVASFPNAEYVVQRREYQDATHPNERTAATYLPENWQVLMEKGQMRLLDGDTALLPGLWGVVTPGHTPGHMSLRLESEGQHAAFVCDMASYAVHFERLAWMTAYDVEPLVTLETKRQWQQWALQTNAVLIFPHDTQKPIGRLTTDDQGRFSITPIDEAYL